ncbi:hypothetical protein RCH16_003417 [Cryobacterium sp. MP_M5]|uniref:helicase HerA domain-containing protein n=1 Tax=unclassified Cryobacterium TaxID=2649013 RepID=UPI0018C9CD07|nr:MULTISPECIES: DUF87 domain-containing protein [unclassified Cryobacterium]MBG6059960.1 hypothetical protein [Cryobacterium sp. MP_M3]MEC5178378.1 hypothetical protein [Cryobacterium sp. MP_M5]
MAATLSLTKRRGVISGIRIGQAVLAVAVLAVFALAAGINPLAEWWFWTAAITAITAAVAEPYYTGSIAALLYGVGGLAAGIAANQHDVEPLWIAYFALAGVVIVAAIIAMVLQIGPAGEAARWVATRFGRPVWLGLAAVTIELIRGVTDRTLPTTALIALGVLIATAISVPDWYRLIIAARPGLGGLTIVESAVDPNLLLVSATTRLTAGQLVQVQGRGRANGVVVGNLAHKSGNRVQIALSSPWTEVVEASGDPVEVELLDSSDGPALGLAADGSTDKVLDLRSFGALTRGDTVYWIDTASSRKYLYQVRGLDLRQLVWDGSAVIAEHARAGLLGTVDAAGIVPDYRLPSPFAPVFSAATVTADLPDGYERIGRIAGTQVPIGISVSSLRGHHLGILGMSGMGKSTIARRVLHLLGNGGTAVAMDGTGEYRSRYGLAEWDVTAGLTTDGESVFEPAAGSSTGKSPAAQARDFIKAAMTAAFQEYKAGTPRHRSILIEEAHSFLPEWNFVVVKGESDIVAESCRMILQARKYGLNFVLVSQRTAVISKSAISQCESYIILRTLDETSLQYVESVAGTEYRDVASSLKRYQAICIGPAFSTSVPVVVDLDPAIELANDDSFEEDNPRAVLGHPEEDAVAAGLTQPRRS